MSSSSGVDESEFEHEHPAYDAGAGPELTVVLPMYNEASVAEQSVSAIENQIAADVGSYEIVCVDDGSSDNTAELINRLADRNPRIVPVHLSRNFGKESAIAAGLEAARGRAVILMDADLQHPPELIHQLLEKWRAGFDVVNAIKQDRGREPVLNRIGARVFYALMGRAIGQRLQGDTDFKLLDRQVVDALLKCGERNRYFRGLVAWVGFRVARVPFKVAQRASGDSKWSFASLAQYAIRNAVAFSSVPLRMVAWLGLFTVLAGAILGVQTLYNYFSGIAVSGFTTVILLIIMLCGLILLSLGVIAVYISHMYEEQKSRPIFLVRQESDARKNSLRRSPESSSQH
jgi:dolichol-phosphate mannosyltransferase